MACELASLVGKEVCAVCADGRLYDGVLKLMDQTTNVIMEGCKEVVYSKDGQYIELEMGTFLLRGENIAFIGEINTSLKQSLPLKTIKGCNINPIEQ